MQFSLNTKIIYPDEKKKIESAIVLLHGYGGDGNDISILINNWKRFLPNTIFLCPDGHEACSINSTGFQWFDLTKEDPEYILQESIKAESKLNLFLKEIKNEYNLSNSNICLSGFSQGCMMCLSIGLTSNEKFNCIIGFSGKIINEINLAKRISSKTKTLLIHGDSDAVVPPNNLLKAQDFLMRNNIEVKTKMIKNCDHHISIEASSLALKYLKKNLII